MRPYLHLYRRCGRGLFLWSMTVAAGTAMLLLWGSLGWAAWQVWAQEWQHLRVQVFCDSEALSEVGALLHQAEFLANIQLISPEQGWRELQSLLDIPNLEGVDSLLPAVYTGQLKPDGDLSRIEHLERHVQQLRGVHAVVVPRERAEYLHRLRQLGMVGWYGLGGVMGLLWGVIAFCALGAFRRRVAEYGVLVLFGVMPWRLRASLLVATWIAAVVGIGVGVGAYVGAWYGMEYAIGSLPKAANLLPRLGAEWISLWGILWCLGNFALSALVIPSAVRRM